MTLLGRPEREVWLMPLGALLDQWEAYKQVNGMAFKANDCVIDRLFVDGI